MHYVLHSSISINHKANVTIWYEFTTFVQSYLPWTENLHSHQQLLHYIRQMESASRYTTTQYRPSIWQVEYHTDRINYIAHARQSEGTAVQQLTDMFLIFFEQQ